MYLYEGGDINLNRKIIIPTIALVAIMGAVTIGTMPVNAESNVYGTLVTRIAQRFNLKESDVEQVVNEVRTERQSQMQARWEARLSQLVSDGKISSAQKELIEAKHNELKLEMQNLSGLSATDRRTKMRNISADLESWAIKNNIDLKVVGLFGMHSGFGHAGGYMKGLN